MKKLTLSKLHESLGGKMIDFAGYYMPIQYEGVIIEHQAVRKSVGVFDVSHMGEIFVKGEEAENFLQYVTSNDVSRLKNGNIQYSCMPNKVGGIIDDLLVYKLGDQEYMLVVNASNLEKDYLWLETQNAWDCSIGNHSEEYSLLAVQGPDSVILLQEITKIDLSSINYYNFKIGEIANISNVIISRTGYTGEIGFELYVKNKDVIKLWDRLFNTSIKLKPIGLAARDTLRLEKGFCLYGNEIDETTSPIEAGLGWITKFNKEFINSEYLKKQKENGVIKKLVGIEIIEKGIARKGYSILDRKGERIGRITSGTMSPSLKKPIAMGYVDSSFNIDDVVYIEIRNKRIKSKIVTLPFVK